MIADLWQDLRYAARNLRRKPAFAALLVTTLALGVGANVAIFSLVDAVLLRSLPVAEPDRLVLFSDGSARGRQLGPPPAWQGRIVLFSFPLYERLRDGAEGWGVAAQDSNVTSSIVRRPGSETDAGDSAKGRIVTSNFFEVLGVSAYRGRTFTASDHGAPGDNAIVVLAFDYWERRFGGDPELIGQNLTVNGAQYRVVGVTPPGFSGATVGGPADFWVNLSMAEAFTRAGSETQNHAYSWLQLFGRLGPGATLESAQANANVSLAPFLADHPEYDAAGPRRIELEAGATGFSEMRQQFREPLLVLMAGVALLLIIVCLNVSHLMLARAMSRQHEMSIRTALGATRARLARQLLTEGCLLAGLGAVGSVFATRWLMDGLLALALSDAAPSAFGLAIEPNERLLVFVVALVLGVALLLGLVPAWHASRSDLQQAMRSTSQAVTLGGARRRISRALMISQVAFSLVLLMSAGLLASSLAMLRAVPLGIDREQVLLAHVNLQAAGLPDERMRFLYEDLPRRLRELPGVRAASLSHPPVLGGRTGWTISFPGTDLPDKNFPLYFVTPDYFDVLGLRIVRGRGFTSTDSGDAPRVAVVNEMMAAKEFGGRDAIGQRIRLDETHDVEIVGVVSDARTHAVRQPLQSLFYLPATQPHGIPAKIDMSSLEVRGSGDPALLTEQVRRTVAEAQSGLPLLNVRTLSDQVDRTLVRERLLATLAIAFGLGALFLVAVGLYGVISQWATQRTRELGVRMALGATAGGVQWMVLRQALVLVLVGLGLGIPGALAAARLLQGVLFEVEPLDPVTLLEATVILLGVATFAAYLPARRASRIDPVIALRSE
jgi:predicted permease